MTTKAKTAEITDEEFDKSVSRAKDVPQSDWAIFCMSLSGYDFSYKGRKMDKWELWHVSHKASEILKHPQVGKQIKKEITDRYKSSRRFYDDNRHLFTYQESNQLDEYARELTPDNCRRFCNIVNDVKTR